MTTQATFLKQFATAGNFELVGTSLFLKTDTLTAKLTLSSTGTHQQWTGMTVKVIGRKNQEILDTTQFKFNDFLEMVPGGRKHDFFGVIQHCGWEWYIMYPTGSSIKEMIGTIETHVSMFE
jgi:hypothetical protein